jgi:hypothetical protein
MHSQSPLCPNCSRPMVIARTIPGVLDEPEVNVFECSCCRVDFMTEGPLLRRRIGSFVPRLSAKECAAYFAPDGYAPI